MTTKFARIRQLIYKHLVLDNYEEMAARLTAIDERDGLGWLKTMKTITPEDRLGQVTGEIRSLAVATTVASMKEDRAAGLLAALTALDKRAPLLRITYRPHRKEPHHWLVATDDHGQFSVGISGWQSPMSDPFQCLMARGVDERSGGKIYQLTVNIPNAEFMRLFRTGVDIVMPADSADQNIVHAIVTMLATLEGATPDTRPLDVGHQARPTCPAAIRLN